MVLPNLLARAPASPGRCSSLVCSAADDLDQLHHRHRVHEVHADDALGALRGRGELGDGDATRCSWPGWPPAPGRASGFRKSSCFELLVLDDGLDEQLRTGAVVERLGRVDAAERAPCDRRRSSCPSPPASRGRPRCARRPSSPARAPRRPAPRRCPPGPRPARCPIPICPAPTTAILLDHHASPLSPEVYGRSSGASTQRWRYGPSGMTSGAALGHGDALLDVARRALTEELDAQQVVAVAAARTR